MRQKWAFGDCVSGLVIGRQGGIRKSFLGPMREGGSLWWSLSWNTKGWGISYPLLVFQDHRVRVGSNTITVNFCFHSKSSQLLHVPSLGHGRMSGLWKGNKQIIGGQKWCVWSFHQPASLSGTYHIGNCGCPTYWEASSRILQVISVYI